MQPRHSLLSVPRAMPPGLGRSAQRKAGADSSKSKVTADKPKRCKNTGYNGANILSRIFFCWIDPLLWLGLRRKQLQQEDLFDTPNYASCKSLQNKFERHWQKELERQSKGSQPRLWVPVLYLMWPRFLGTFLAASVVIALTTLQSIILGWLSDYFTGPKTPESTKNAFLMALTITLAGFISAVCRTWELELALETGTRIRVAATGMILKHSINLHLQTVGTVSIGKIMSLSSTDVHRFDQAFLFLHYLILVPLQTVVVLMLLWFYIGLGPSCLPGLILLMLQLPMQYVLSKIYMYLRLKAAQYTDDRIKATNQFLSGIRVIKMYGWEYAFSKLVAGTRKMETIMIALANLFRSVNSAYLGFSTVLINLLIFPTYALTTGNPITPTMVFTTLSLVTFVKVLTFFYIVEAVLGVREIKVAFKRIQDFLLRDHSDHQQLKHYSHNPVLIPELNISQHLGKDLGGSPPQMRVLSKGTCASVKVNNLSAAWTGGNEEEPTLQNISFECNMANRMLAIVGPVGAGKSSILYCLLGELEPLSGEVAIVGSLGYAAQEPWLYTGSVRENILFGLEYEEEWYQKVVDACCLREDIEQLAVGDMTLVGERGVSLSGGQKARVTLARAVYRKADIYLLDDPLSAVDTAVGRLLFENCLCGLLKDSIVVLVTHQLQYAKMADNMLVISQGQSIAYGSFKGIIQRQREDSTTDATLNEMLGDLTRSTEKESSGDELNSHEEGTKRKSKGLQSGFSTNEGETFNNVLPEEDKHQGSISFKTYLCYFREGAWCIFLCFMIVLFLMTQASLVTSDSYISQWATSNYLCGLPNATDLLCNLTVNVIVEIFAGLAGCTIVLGMMRAVLFYLLCVNAARNLHNKMFSALLRAPVRFFDTNPIGRILTRFSKDLFFLDNMLPRQFFDLLDQLLQVLAVLVVAGVANVYMLIAGAAVTVALLCLRYYYVPRAVELRRLEAVARSPVYSHITDSLRGLTTIRACKRKNATMEHFYYVMDENTKGWMFYINSNRWFALRSDLIATVFIGVVAFSSIPMASFLNPGFVSLSLVYALSLSEAFRRSVRNSADVEGMMVSVERAIAYSKLEPEAPLETPPSREKPPEAWPQHGGIQAQQVNFRYAEDTPYILKDVSIDIKPGEKVGVVGRTGAGKSSLMQALFRMAEPEGNIWIDGVNITEVGLHTLRKKLSIIPQDPVIFSGSVRYNLDPFGDYSDETIWGALEQVQLKMAVVDLPGGLDAALTEGGSNFSMGQRQLLCLARALLKKNKILIIDEATANVDRVTDAIIQQTIRRELADSTTLTIAHRLNTIMDSDRIMVLSAGRIVEFDTPHTLLQNKESMLSHLVEQVTPGESEQLRETAAKYRVMVDVQGGINGKLK